MDLNTVAGLLAKPAGAVLGQLQTPHLPHRHPQFGYRNALDAVQGRTLEKAVRGRTVVITGASSGIGEATALRVAAAGGQVVLLARRDDRLAAVAEAIEAAGGRAFTYPCDLADVSAAARVADKVLTELGRVDILVNNAGLSIRRSLTASYERISDVERTLAVNYVGAVQLILKFVPGMRERRFGHILNVSTIAAQTRMPRFAAYTASKVALETFCDVVQAETAADNVRFSTVHMGLVRTAMIAPTRDLQNFPAMSAEQAAGVLCDAIVHRPRRATTPIGRIVAAGDTIVPTVIEQIRSRLT